MLIVCGVSDLSGFAQCLGNPPCPQPASFFGFPSGSEGEKRRTKTLGSKLPCEVCKHKRIQEEFKNLLISFAYFCFTCFDSFKSKCTHFAQEWWPNEYLAAWEKHRFGMRKATANLLVAMSDSASVRLLAAATMHSTILYKDRERRIVWQNCGASPFLARFRYISMMVFLGNARGSTLQLCKREVCPIYGVPEGERKAVMEIWAMSCGLWMAIYSYGFHWLKLGLIESDWGFLKDCFRTSSKIHFSLLQFLCERW